MNTLSRILLLLLVLSFSPLSASEQIKYKVRILDGTTHKPVNKIYCYILKNGDRWIAINHTNEQGECTIRVDNESYDTMATYQITTVDNRFYPIYQNIDLTRDEGIILTIFPDSNYLERKPDLVYRDCSLIGFGWYYPRTPQSMDDLPDTIRTKLHSHLVARLGQEFYSRLRINGGQIVDLSRLYIADPKARDFRWTPYSYYICFSFEDTAKGIGLYSAKIILDKDGNVVQEIELPNIRKHPHKGIIIPLPDAKKIAQVNGFHPDSTSISLDYDKKEESIAWCFTQSVFSSEYGLQSVTLRIDAYSGKVIDTGKSGEP